MGFKAKEIPYSKINPRELKDLEAEFGRTLTPELAQCLIRYRMNRDAIELMLRDESGGHAPALGSSSRAEPSEIRPTKRTLKSADAKEGPKEETKSEEEEALKSARQRGARRAARQAVA
jgi:hypothetical protein